MSRPLRIEIPGAVYHVTLREDRREPTFRDDEDRVMFLAFSLTPWSASPPWRRPTA